MAKTALVTGASSGIGMATAQRLRVDGFDVIAAARRKDRLDALADESGVTPVIVDVTSDESVAALAQLVAGFATLDVVVNNAGGALGLEPVAEADIASWQTMYETNVLGSVRVIKALLPKLAADGGGHVVMVTSVAGRFAYEGGAGYNAAKFGQVAVTEALRLELNGWPVRVTDIAPGMVRTEEFSLTRFGGDAERAAKVYEGVADPLVAADVADAIAWAVTRPAHVNIDQLVIKPLAQAATHKVHRGELRVPE